MLALYEGPHDSDAHFEVVLDGVKVSHFPEDLIESERWLSGYPIRLEHPDRELALGSHILYLFAATGVDKEDWFLTCVRAAMVHEEVRRSPARSMGAHALVGRRIRAICGRLPSAIVATLRACSTSSSCPR